MNPFLKFLLTRLLPCAIFLAVVAAILGREPNFKVEWARAVPSKDAPGTLSSALNDAKDWPIFHHALKSVEFAQDGKPLSSLGHLRPGSTAIFHIEPRDKEWKRFDIRAEAVAPGPGESVRFRLTNESSGKTTRLLNDFEWWVGVRTATEAEAKRGNRSTVAGGCTAETKTFRARLLGRFAPSILMNQLYQIDLVRLANYTENKEAWAKDNGPPHQ